MKKDSRKKNQTFRGSPVALSEFILWLYRYRTGALWLLMSATICFIDLADARRLSGDCSPPVPSSHRHSVTMVTRDAECDGNCRRVGSVPVLRLF